MISNWFTASNHRLQPGQCLFMLVKKVLKLNVHFVFLKLRISHVFKQQEAEDSPKLLYNEFSREWLPDVGFSGTHVLCQQLAQRMDTWRHRYFLSLIQTLPALCCLQPVSATAALACAMDRAAQISQISSHSPRHRQSAWCHTFCITAVILLSHIFWKGRCQTHM